MADLFYRIVGALGYHHPLHPVLTHLVIGPVVAAFVFELIGVIRKKESFRRTAWYLSIFALVAWVFTVTNGFFDWIHFYNMSTIREITIKIVLSGVLLVILISVVTVHRQLSERSIIPLILLTLATVNVGALGFFGGNLVYGGSKEPVAAETTAAPQGWNETKVNDFTLDSR